MWGASELEMSVERPGVEVIGAWGPTAHTVHALPLKAVARFSLRRVHCVCYRWGFRNELQTWTWPGYPASAVPLTVRAYGSSGCVVLSLNGKPIAGGVGAPSPHSVAHSARTLTASWALFSLTALHCVV